MINNKAIITQPNKLVISVSQSNNTFGLMGIVYWWQYWMTLMDFLWIGLNYQNVLISSFFDRRKIFIGGRDFGTDYIPETSGATFELQPDADLILDDVPDNLWFDNAGNSKIVSVSDLYNIDYSRTIVKYTDSSPFDVSAIGVLKNGVVLTSAQEDQLEYDFKLWFFRTGFLNPFGSLKSNRFIP